LNFGSDNVYGVHPKIMDAIVAANTGTARSYCYDDASKEVEFQLSTVFEKEVRAFLVMNGTGANSLALSSLVPPFGGIICHTLAHINTDECNAPELFTGGAKLITVEGAGAKIRPDGLSRKIKTLVQDEHGSKLSALSITNLTELGTAYSPAEISDLSAIAKSHAMKLHMDGSRFANALVSQNCTPAALTWKAGVDALSFGGTKNGGMILEAVVFFDLQLADDFLYRRKRAGQLLSKSRFLSAQMLAYLKDGLWLDNAKWANRMAHVLAAGLQQSQHIKVQNSVDGNEVFAVMPRKLYETLIRNGIRFNDWPIDGLADDEVHTRFVLSWATPEEDVTQFLKLVQSF
jgi:threonine aldolase